MVDWTIVLGQVIQAVVLIVIPFISALVGKFINKKIKEVDNDIVRRLIATAVLWVEQKYTKTLTSEQKYEEVAKFIHKQVAKLGIKLDEDELETLIEAAVRNLTGEASKNLE